MTPLRRSRVSDRGEIPIIGVYNEEFKAAQIDVDNAEATYLFELMSWEQHHFKGGITHVDFPIEYSGWHEHQEKEDCYFRHQDEV